MKKMRFRTGLVGAVALLSVGGVIGGLAATSKPPTVLKTSDAGSRQSAGSTESTGTSGTTGDTGTTGTVPSSTAAPPTPTVAPTTTTTTVATTTSQALVAVPDVGGKSAATAVALIDAAGLTPLLKCFPGGPFATVYGQTPAAGTEVAPGTTVSYSLSSNPEPGGPADPCAD